ncbi:MAG: SRPBCC domain-containing protein [Cytophagaceae bacterium]|jgi:hypothetical protein|nr:SRPBCC domain-containing protein [Cytophagaceae bacterium]
MKIYSEITIEASAERVWNVLMDKDAYSSWNPFIVELSGTLKQGETITAVIQNPGSSSMTFKPKVLVCNAERELRWLGSLGFKGIFDGEHVFELEVLGPEKTLFKHSETFSGILVNFFKKSLKEKTLPGFESMNQALKKRCEQ